MRRSSFLQKIQASGFSLLELLVVIAIVGLLSIMALPSVNSILDGTKISTAAEQLAGSLSSARQAAVTAHCEVEWRLISCTPADDPSGPVTPSGIQIVRIGETGVEPLGRILRFPAGVAISEDSTNSSLIDLPLSDAAASDTRLHGTTSYRYRAFRFQPDGSTDLEQRLDGVPRLYLTILRAGTSADDRNLATVEIQPRTGSFQIHRP